MNRAINARWKALPLKRRLMLALLLETPFVALAFLAFQGREGGSGAEPGQIAAVALLLISGAGLARYGRRWMNHSAEDDSASRARSTNRRSLFPGIFGAALLLLLQGYVLLLVFPHPLFPYELTYRGFTVRSDQPLPTAIRSVLDSAAARLAAAAVHDGTAHHTIFLSGSYPKFALFAREHFGAFGIRSPIGGHIFISKSDPERSVVVRFGGDRNERGLSGVITHEAVHGLLAKAPDGRDLPRWKEEGYAEYVTGESTFDYAEGVRLMAQGRNVDSNAFRYLKYRLLVEYLLDEKEVAFEEFLTTRYDPRQLEAELLRIRSSQLP
jgi:hypothetical protein